MVQIQLPDLRTDLGTDLGTDLMTDLGTDLMTDLGTDVSELKKKKGPKPISRVISKIN